MPDTQGLPWPKGDPGAARAAAHRASALAGSLRGLGHEVGATSAAGWSGQAASAFHGAVNRDAMAVSAAAGSFDAAAGALNMLATRTERARERVLEAADKLRAAREAARTAASRATEARGAATAAHARAALDPSSALGGPLLTEAGMAEDAAQRAESLASDAQAELERVTRWAEQEARDAVEDAERADHEAASELESATTGPGASGTGAVGGGAFAAGAAVGGGGPLRHLGGYLGGDLFNYWSGGPDRETLPIGKLAQGGAFMYGTTKYLRAARVAESWARVAPGGAGTLTAYAADLRTAALPTFNNGFLGKGVARGLSAVPATSGAGSWMANASKATPVFRRLGVAGGAFSTVMDGKHLIEQGNPVTAFKRDGAGYVADVGRTAFSASSTAFLVAPNPVTGGAVIVSGVVWGGAEAWDHRHEIAGAVSSGAEWAFDHSAAGAVWNNREEIGAALDSGLDTAKDIGGDALDAGGDVLDAGGDLLDKVPTPW